MRCQVEAVATDSTGPTPNRSHTSTPAVALDNTTLSEVSRVVI